MITNAIRQTRPWIWHHGGMPWQCAVTDDRGRKPKGQGRVGLGPSGRRWPGPIVVSPPRRERCEETTGWDNETTRQKLERDVGQLPEGQLGQLTGRMGEEEKDLERRARLQGVPSLFFKGFQMGKEGPKEASEQPASRREGGDFGASQLSRECYRALFRKMSELASHRRH